MEVTLRKMGNSTAFVMPPPILRDLGLSAGRSLRIQATPDGKLLLEPTRKYKLSDLIAQCDLKAAPPVDMVAWERMPQVGGEIL
jgi:antitoxin ChpS